MSVRVLIRDHPHRTVALASGDHALVFRHSHSITEHSQNSSPSNLSLSNTHRQNVTPRCMVEFARRDSIDLQAYRTVNSAQGTLGLITLNNDVFLCAIITASQVASVRPGETVQRINSVEFYCLNRSDYDHTHGHEPNPYPGESFGSDDIDYGGGFDQSDSTAEHPFHALRKLLSNGNFYYSCDFDLTSRLQERAENDASFDIGNLDEDLLWNSYMVNPLLQFRSRLTERQREELDRSRILTSVIRGFARSLTIPLSFAPLRRVGPSHLPPTLTVISRLSSRRAGTRFNSRGIDDDGNVANFVETETIFWSPSGVCFSYVQIRGSVPVFWESTTSLLPGQQKIQITRSSEATQPAFDKHFERLALTYGAVHIVNLLSASKPGEVELTQKFRSHAGKSPLRQGGGKNETSERHPLRQTEFDFHAETKGAGGYGGARSIWPYLETSADNFAYFMSEEITEKPRNGSDKKATRKSVVVLQQEGVFRINCLDCLDRTNLVQGMISQMAIEAFLSHRSEVALPEFWVRHSSLWADNGDTLSKIYAGTGALKSSFTRHGKMSLGGAIADARKSATRLYVNNFADKGRQNTIDLLLGRLMGQAPVDLYDPVNDYVTSETQRRAPEYTSSKSIRIWCGTFNINGKSQGASEDLSPWLCSAFSHSRVDPEIMAVGFQEMVELSPQQIMSTDPARRSAWENAVKKTLNSRSHKTSSDDYVLLRSGQLVGAALMIFVKASVLDQIKSVEGAIKKTGMSGIAGNKGAVAIRLEYASTSLCFVTAHLAAGFANYDERNRDYQTISHGLRFQKNRSIDDHDSVVWLGDFNYRIGLSNERARRLVHNGDLETLYENDQLNIQMVAGMVFQYYSESRITFPPTYRFDLGTDDYDTSEKARIPAWCDRVLRRGTNLRQIDYNTAPLRFSDHKPVFATFECNITIVDEVVKTALSKKLYDKRRKEVGTTHAAADGTNDELESNTDDEADLIGYDSIAPDLPPASSDRRKWWLDNDKPARSELQPPRNGMVPNPNRAVNPYKSEMTDEPDWVDVQTPSSREGSRSRSRTMSSQKPDPPPARRTSRNVVAAPGGGTSESQMKSIDNHRDLLRSVPDDAQDRRPPPPASRSLGRSSSTSVATLKKAPPPKPKKPSSLASPPSQTTTFTLASSDRDNAGGVPPNPNPTASSTTTLRAAHPALVQAGRGPRNTLPFPQDPTNQSELLRRPHAQSQPQSPSNPRTTRPSPPRLPSRTNTSSSIHRQTVNSPASHTSPPRAPGALRKPGPIPPPTQPQPQTPPAPNTTISTMNRGTAAALTRGAGGGEGRGRVGRTSNPSPPSIPTLPPRPEDSSTTTTNTDTSTSTSTSADRASGRAKAAPAVVDLMGQEGEREEMRAWKALVPSSPSPSPS